MKLLHHDNEYAQYRCRCGQMFDVDAVTQENLVYQIPFGKSHRELLPQCPKCKTVDIRVTEEDIEEICETVGMYHMGWDMVNPEDLISAIILQHQKKQIQ